jgi:2-oxoglutarate dehydrogenase E2 component (dihydrolipoamide succinyltransferase)
MAIDIKVPSVGESVTEAVLARWLKKDGDPVKRDEPVAELESDKATQEIPAPAAGTVRVAVPEGTTVPVGAVIGRVEEGAAAPAPAPAAAPAKPETAPAKPETAPAKAAPAAHPREAAMSPSARVLVESKGIDASQLTGSGRGGRITKEDVLARVPSGTSGNGAAATAPPAPPAPAAPAPPGERETRQRMSPVRQRIAARLIESQQTTASLTTFNEADLSAVQGLRAKYKDRFKERYGVSLGFSAFFVKACVEALKAFPAVNARIDGPDIVYQNFYDIGVAVSTEKGLMVPVLRGCDRLSFAQIEKAVADLAAKARDGRIAVGDLQGGTFTITNGGVFGSLLSTPILNPPQTAILGMHAIQKRPVAVNDQVVIRPMMYLALTYDHRLIDGREAVQFLVRVKECVEDPERQMLEV